MPFDAIIVCDCLLCTTSVVQVVHSVGCLSVSLDNNFKMK